MKFKMTLKIIGTKKNTQINGKDHVAFFFKIWFMSI